LFKYDFIVVVTSIFTAPLYGINFTGLRIIKVIFDINEFTKRMIIKKYFYQKLLETLLNSFISILTVLFIDLIVLIIFATSAMHLFGEI